MGAIFYVPKKIEQLTFGNIDRLPKAIGRTTCFIAERCRWQKKRGDKGAEVKMLSILGTSTCSQWMKIRSPQPEKTTCFDKSFFQLYLPAASYIAAQLYLACAE